MRKAILDDGCNPELVAGADFDGILEIPIIKRPKSFLIPSSIIPFSFRRQCNNRQAAIGFFEKDICFSDILIHPEHYIDDFKKFSAIISPDCSLYRDAPLSVQITNIYRNRAIGYYFQKNGIYVIPQIRWGTEDTYTTKRLPERAAFLGVEKHSIIAIGTYGCIKHKDDKYFFKSGLEAMLETLEPQIILVYGAMPESVFGDYKNATTFIHYDDWTTAQHKAHSIEKLNTR